jgi:SAM-dependent methyltransferase
VVRQRRRIYVQQLAAHAPVLEVGCGRGELLDLLAEVGVAAVGVDVNETMVAHCIARGRVAYREDARHFLSAQADDSLGAIFSAWAVDYLPQEELRGLMELAHRKLRPKGLLLLEAANPHCLATMKTYWADLSRLRPVFPEALVQLCWLQGFDEAMVVFPEGVGDLRLDRWRQEEYAVIARKAGRLS